MVLDKVMYENRIIKSSYMWASVYVFSKRKWLLLLVFKEGKPKFTRFILICSRMILTKVYQSTLICLEKWKMKKLASPIYLAALRWKLPERPGGMDVRVSEEFWRQGRPKGSRELAGDTRAAGDFFFWTKNRRLASQACSSGKASGQLRMSGPFWKVVLYCVLVGSGRIFRLQNEQVNLWQVI